ncbi:MAG: stage V sporulation protein AC [Thermoanaerobacteraceae bacterium]|uniref:stage V sporulation protein AC n=1 Tax=Thermanaeromonas sp. C210 TaxID=2731925 RepID=UPI00155D32DD|nr:stage V sporulation protein AC [Thermanaeromonas sp. C210]MBE3582255.1 stage V sporulation protein AC [Thermoanaerobacteraceae bacterium]GFN23414.1 stage V sporulation protein AC [Thermanaeromonas sp. C210]
MADQTQQPGPPKKPLSLAEQIAQQQQAYEQQAYQKLVEQIKPKPKVWVNVLNAFWVGGTICGIAQIITLIFREAGLSAQDASNATAMIMVFLGALLTGLGVYDEIGKRAGAGSIIPITGFANSIVSPAMEFKREGFIYGVGARLFTVAGPVIIYGLVTSVLIGLVAYFVS